MISGQGLVLPTTETAAAWDESAVDRQSPKASHLFSLPEQIGQDATSTLAKSHTQSGVQNAATRDAAYTADLPGSNDADLAADADDKVSEAKRRPDLEQHPWLLYFYDKTAEADYAKYHASRMLKVCHSAYLLLSNTLSSRAALYCAALSHVMPFCAALLCVMSRCIVLCPAVLCCARVCRAMLCNAALRNVKSPNAVPCHDMPSRAVLCCAVRHCVLLRFGRKHSQN